MPRGPTPPESLLDIADVAKLTGLSPRTIVRHITSGKLPARKVGHVWRLKPSELETWWQAQPGTPVPLECIAQDALRQELVHLITLCERVYVRPEQPPLLKDLQVELAALNVKLRAALKTLKNGTHDPPEETPL